MKSNRLLGIQWSTLGRFHAIKAVRTMYFWVLVVPIAAKLLEHTGGQATIYAFGSSVRLQLALPFSWIAFYFSAVCFALAEVVYLARCPLIVREQSTYAQFRNAGKGVEHLDQYVFEIQMNWEGLRQRIERQDDYFIEVAEAENPSQPDGLLRRQFWAAYSTADSHRAWSQLASALLYLLGTSLIFIVAAQNLRFVLEYLFDRS